MDERERTLLIVDDDRPFLQRLALAMERRDFRVTAADSIETAARNAAAPTIERIADLLPVYLSPVSAQRGPRASRHLR